MCQYAFRTSNSGNNVPAQHQSDCELQLRLMVAEGYKSNHCILYLQATRNGA